MHYESDFDTVQVGTLQYYCALPEVVNLTVNVKTPVLSRWYHKFKFYRTLTMQQCYNNPTETYSLFASSVCHTHLCFKRKLSVTNFEQWETH